MFFNEKIEVCKRAKLDAIVEKRIQYTVKYASEHSLELYRIKGRPKRIVDRR